MLRRRSLDQIKSVGLSLLNVCVVTLVGTLGHGSVNLLGSLNAPKFKDKFIRGRLILNSWIYAN